MIRVRHTNAWVGLLVLAAVAVLIVAILEAGFLRDWFKPTSELRLILPATGVAGLEVGADVEVLGTKAGIVRRIILDPSQQMYALIEIGEQFTAFIRRDSAAIIRRRFGVAGAAFVDISRGTGEEIDWSYAVIEATTERAPTDSINAMIDQVQGKVFPILDNAGRATQALAEIMERINRGEGNIGRVLVDQTLMQQAEATVESANQAVAGLNQLLAKLQQSVGDVNELTGKSVPALMKRAGSVMSELQAVLKDLAQASTRMPAISRNVESSTANLPALLTQLQVTTQELDRLVVQLRGWWLLGGGPPPQAKQFSPSQVLP